MELPNDSVPPAVREWLPPDFALYAAPDQGETAWVAFVRDAPLVVKRARGPVYTTWLEHELRALIALAGTDLPIPEPIGLHSWAGPPGSDGEAWLVMTRLPGEPLTRAVARAGTVQERAAWYAKLGALTALIHTQAIPSDLRPDDDRRWLERVLARARVAPGRWVQKLTARFDRDRPPEVPETLIHGDLTIDNVLADEDGLTGVIDWGAAGPGDPRYDVTLALSRIDDTPLEPMVVAAFLEGYGSRGLPSELRAFFEHAYDLL